MNTTAEVYLWETRIGIIHQDIDKPYAAFEYDTDFLKSGIELSPIMMPLGGNIYEFPLLSGEPCPALLPSTHPVPATARTYDLRSCQRVAVRSVPDQGR